MSAIPSKQQAFYLPEKAGPFAVQERDVPKPGPGELLVENHSIGLNPVDWVNQAIGLFIREYPAILGLDAAGIIKAVGEGVTDFAVGERVLCIGNFDASHGTFQQYSLVNTYAAAKLPANYTYDEGAAIPLVLNTAAFGLYGKSPIRAVQLTAPYEEGGSGKYAGQAILVVAGATGVGQQVVQLAKLSGFSPIIATASLRNEVLLKSLGADHVIDRNAPLVESVRKITDNVGIVYDAISVPDTQIPAYEVLAPGGTLVAVMPPQIPAEKIDASKKVVHVNGTAHDPEQREDGVELWANVTALLERYQLRPNRVEVLPGGFAGIDVGLQNLRTGQASAVKYIVHPREA